VLTRQCRRIERALRDNIATRSKSMPIVREIAASAVVKIAGNACAAGISVIRIIGAYPSHHGFASRCERSKARCADSESQFLAMKKFSCFRRHGRIGPRQNQFFERIAGHRFARRSGPARCVYGAMKIDRRPPRRSKTEFANQ
jgi:hypothetical protein